MELFNEIRTWITFLADVCILLITIYTFYLTFLSKKIKVISFGRHLSWEGDSMNIVLENKSLSPISITRIDAIVEKKNKFKFRNFDEPLILPPFSTKVVVMSPYSHMPDFNFDDIVFQIATSSKTRIVHFKKRVFLSRKVKKDLPNVMIVTRKFNDKVIMPGTKYILTLKTNEGTKTICIFGNGVMTDNIFGYNGIPEEIVEDEQKLRLLLDSMIEPYGARYILTYEDFKI